MMTGQLMITIATPVSHDGQVLGVVGGDLTLETLANMVSSLDLGEIACNAGDASLQAADARLLAEGW